MTTDGVQFNQHETDTPFHEWVAGESVARKLFADAEQMLFASNQELSLADGG